jgi:hypothetical protein
MRTHPSVRNLSILCPALAVLLACAEPRIRPPEAPTELDLQVASLQRYVSQMEKTYAAQEAEILALRREIAGSATCALQIAPAARFASGAATGLAARESVAF